MTVQWRKSSYSTGVDDETCVELARFPSGVGVRDSKNPAGGALSLSRVQFVRLARKIKDA